LIVICVRLRHKHESPGVVATPAYEQFSNTLNRLLLWVIVTLEP